jgi:benzoyl-CoA 2,3-epoxidase subunit A
MNAPLKQHLIDPEICIRCYTCEEVCPIDAITHNEDNVVVDASKCDFCMACIAPCPTGSIDEWRVVMEPYSLEEQMEWTELPAQGDIASGTEGTGGDIEALEDSIEKLLADAHSGTGGKARAPASATKASVNLYNLKNPATAIVQGNFRLTSETADSDVRHIILDLGGQSFPVLEGQSVGIIPPGTDANGNPHLPRLYSISSPRDGERPNTNNVSLTVKREPHGIASNYVCDLKKGDTVALTGPFGATFLMPNDPQANIIMVCTGTGSAPFRAFTMRTDAPVLRRPHAGCAALFRTAQQGARPDPGKTPRLFAGGRRHTRICAGPDVARAGYACKSFAIAQHLCVCLRPQGHGGRCRGRIPRHCRRHRAGLDRNPHADAR